MFLNYYYLEYEMERAKLKCVKIQLGSDVFDRIKMDRAAKFVDMLSAVGGTMGLLTGFSIISGVEILYFCVKMIVGCIGREYKKKDVCE